MIAKAPTVLVVTETITARRRFCERNPGRPTLIGKTNRGALALGTPHLAIIIGDA
jgi:hypothetical protein